jgi:hypothetical protein
MAGWLTKWLIVLHSFFLRQERFKCKYDDKDLIEYAMKDLTDVILKDLICDVRLTIVRKVHDERGHPISHEDAMTHMISNKNDYLDVQRRIS